MRQYFYKPYEQMIYVMQCENLCIIIGAKVLCVITFKIFKQGRNLAIFV
jgi:hypothetical protein